MSFGILAGKSYNGERAYFISSASRKQIVQPKEIVLTEDKVQDLTDTTRCQDQDGECDGDRVDHFDDVQGARAHYLNERVQVHTFGAHVSQVGIVRLVFGGHEEDEDAVKQLL